MPPSYIRVRAIVWAYGRRQTDRHRHTHADTQTRVTTIYFASPTTHAKCNEETDFSKRTYVHAVREALNMQTMIKFHCDNTLKTDV